MIMVISMCVWKYAWIFSSGACQKCKLVSADKCFYMVEGVIWSKAFLLKQK